MNQLYMNIKTEIDVKNPWSLAFSNNDKYLIVGGYEPNDIYIYETKNLTLVR